MYALRFVYQYISNVVYSKYNSYLNKKNNIKKVTAVQGKNSNRISYEIAITIFIIIFLYCNCQCFFAVRRNSSLLA